MFSSWGLKSVFSTARNSHFLVFGVLLLYSCTTTSQSSAKCAAKISPYRHCRIDPDGVRDLDCSGKYRSAGQITCKWTPANRSAPASYTLTVQQPNTCKVTANVTGLSRRIPVFTQHNLTVQVVERGATGSCTKAVFKGSPADLYFCGPPKSASFSRLAGTLRVDVNWTKEDAKTVQSLTVRHKVLGERRWSESLVGSANGSSCRVGNLNASLAYVLQIRCVTSPECSQCPWSQDYTVPPELTSEPVIDNFLDTDIEDKEGQRLVTVSWKAADGERNDGYAVTLWKASGETAGERTRTSKRRIRLVLSYSSYLLNISAVNNVSVSPAVSRTVPRREDTPGMRDGRLNVTALHSNSLAVSWRDDLVPSLVCFSVEWTETGGRTMHMSFYEGAHKSRTLSPLPEPLKPHRRYRITLHTRPNRHTCNMQRVNNSESTYGSTQFYLEEAPPLAAPANVSVSGVTPDSATLRWWRIPEEDCRGFLLGYTVHFSEYDHRGNATETDVSVSPALNSYKLEALESGTTYQVRISGFTSAGAGPRSTASFFRTDAKGSFDLKRLVAVFAVLAVALTVASPIVKRVKSVLWPKIPNPRHSDALQKIEGAYELELLEALSSLPAEECDTKSLLVLENDVPSPADQQPPELPALEDPEDSPEEDAETVAGDSGPGSSLQPSCDLQASLMCGYTTMEMFHRGVVVLNAGAAGGGPPDSEAIEAKPGAQYVRQFSASPPSDGEDADGSRRTE